MDRVKKSRSAHKGNFTTLVQQIKDVVALPDSDERNTEIQVKLKSLSSKFEKITSLTDELEQLIPVEDIEQLDQLLAEQGRLEEDYYRAQVMAERALSVTAKAPAAARPVVQSLAGTEDGNAIGEQDGADAVGVGGGLGAADEDESPRGPSLSRQATVTAKLKLPVVELKTFDGDVFGWAEFWDRFSSSVDRNDSISKVDKFVYLKRYLKGDAEKAVTGIPLTAENYGVAVELLRGRFGQPAVMKTAHMTALLDLPGVRNVTDVRGLRNLHDQGEIHLRGLQGLKMLSTEYSSMLTPLFVKKLPEELAIQWIMKANCETATFEELLDFLKQEVEGRERVHLMIGGRREQGAERRHDGRRGREGHSAMALVAGTSRREGGKRVEGGSGPRGCLFCKQQHSIAQCRVPVEERIRLLTREKRCFQCLKTGHRADACEIATYRCRQCDASHNYVICRKREQPSGQATEPATPMGGAGPAAVVSHSLCTNSRGDRIMQTATVFISGPHGRCRATCLLDPGSDESYMTEKIAQEMGLPVVGEALLSISGFGEDTQPKTRRYERCNLEIQGTFPEAPKIQLGAFKVKKICLPVPTKKTRLADDLWLKGLLLADDRIITGNARPEDVDLLIGIDQYWRIVGREQIREGDGDDGLVAMNTRLGWVISGPVKGSYTAGSVNATSLFIRAETAVEEDSDIDLRQFWELDHIGIKDPGGGRKEVEPLEDFDQLITRTPEGRYRVPLPWKENKSKLKSNYKLAETLLRNQVQRLEKTPGLLENYNNQIEEYLKLGFVSDAGPVAPGGVEHYLAHHPVIRTDKKTTKIRIVFNASGKEGKNPSLNDCLEAGPNLNPELLAVLLRFRNHPIAFIGDIEKAFLQIELEPDDRDAVRFLWLQDFKNPATSPVRILRWNRVVFGVNSSPFLLVSTVRKHVLSQPNLDAETLEMILKQLYVDDLLGGADTREKAVKAVTEVKETFADARMKMTKWLSNDPELQRMLMDGEIAREDVDGALAYILTGQESTKVLGISWDPAGDYFTFDPSAIIAAAKEATSLTKSQLLSISSRMFDPLGFLSPLIISIKIIFQELWQTGVGWKEEVPAPLKTRWLDVMSGMEDLKGLKIPRNLMPVSPDPEEPVELHVFCDASKAAYGAVAYLRSVKEDRDFHTCLVASKTRVAPLQEVSLPRLELLGAVLAARLANYILSSIHFKKISVWFWTDSTLALGWITGDVNRWKTFVRNRVEEIRKLSSPEWWSHCPGLENPADLPSRGVSASALVGSQLWWEGPPWLRQPQDARPSRHLRAMEVEAEAPEVAAERRAVVVAVSQQTSAPYPLLDLIRYSSLTRVTRITAWMFRFLRNRKKELRAPREEVATEVITVRGGDGATAQVAVECLTAAELNAAEMFWVRCTQIEMFSEEYRSLRDRTVFPRTSPIGVLRPRFDRESAVVRVVGRTEPVMKKTGTLPPLLLPDKHRFVELLIRNTHLRLKHSGAKTTQLELRERYWIVKSWQRVKSIIHQCVPCRRHHSRHFDEPAADLPLERTTEAEPFAVCGVDFAGPLYFREKGVTDKSYVCLFTCAVTRAVHLELVKKLDTKSFLLALQRYWARRGISSIIYSDNAKTFHKASRQLNSLRAGSALAVFLADRRVEWRFIASRAPWWGGWWERMVRTTKDLLKKSLGRALLTMEQLHTVLVEIESIINSRPLTYMAAEEGECEPLTPSHLISGKRTTALPKPVPLQDQWNRTAQSLVRRERYRQSVLEHWWRKWKKEYLADLRRFSNAQISSGRRAAIRAGDVVLIHDETKRFYWRHGLVTELIPGQDGRVRKVKLRTATGVIYRPIQRLYPTEVHHESGDGGRNNEEDHPAKEANGMEQPAVKRPAPDKRSNEPVPVSDVESPVGMIRGGSVRKSAVRVAEPGEREGLYTTRRGRPVFAPKRLRD